jgi:hypothetical protein
MTLPFARPFSRYANLRLIERRHSVDHWSDARRLEELTDLGKLLTVWTHEQE